MFVPIAERVYGIKARFGSSPFSVWAYAVTDPGSRRLLLIDSGGLGSGRPIMRAIQALGYSPRDVVGIAITHWHGDHTGGICELLDVTDHPVTIYGARRTWTCTWRKSRCRSRCAPPGLPFAAYRSHVGRAR